MAASNNGAATAEPKEVDRDIKDGDAGIRQTVRHMARLISRDATDGKIRAKARSLRGSTDEQTIRNIYDYVYKNYEYKSDPDDREVVSAPRHLLDCAEGDCNLPSWAGLDCDDLTVMLCALYKAAGYKCLIKIIDWKPDSTGFTHVYPLVEIPSRKGYIPTDAVAKAKGYAWEKSPVKRYEVYDMNGNLVTKGTGKSSTATSSEQSSVIAKDKTDSLMGTATHNEIAGVKKWWQNIEEHAGLITATTAVVSVVWAMYLYTKSRS